MNILYTNRAEHSDKSIKNPGWPGLDKDIVNLRLDELVRILSAGIYPFTPEDLCEIFCSDESQIIYRQQILKGVADHPGLHKAFKDAADGMKKIKDKLEMEKHTPDPLRKEILEYYILQDYIRVSDLLLAALKEETGLTSELEEMKAAVEANRKASGADAVMEKLATLDMNWLKTRSVWVGVNLSPKPQMKPYALVIGEFSDKPYESNCIFDNEIVEEGLGISKLKPLKLNNDQSYLDRLILINFHRRYKEQIKAFEKVFQFNRSTVIDFCELETSLHFYLACINFAQRLSQAGYPVCLPQIAPPEEDAFVAKKLVSAGLIFGSENKVVSNDINLSSRFFVLTGANHSGKTEFLISVAQAQWLTQLGCYVPAESLRVSPVPSIMTLFSSGETQRYDESRMGNEVRQFSEISAAMAPHTLLLLNEPMTSTNPEEGAAICCDMVNLILQKGGRGIMVTHLYELFGMLDEKGVDRSRIGSLVTKTLLDESGSTVKTYKVEEREPEYKSYALELSRQAGITLEQFIQEAKRDNFELPINPEILSQLHGR